MFPSLISAMRSIYVGLLSELNLVAYAEGFAISFVFVMWTICTAGTVINIRKSTQ